MLLGQAIGTKGRPYSTILKFIIRDDKTIRNITIMNTGVHFQCALSMYNTYLVTQQFVNKIVTRFGSITQMKLYTELVAIQHDN
jgi:hypothetical protein